MCWRRFGRGRHPAGLNYGDTFSYALARRMGLPLLFAGEDFARTDAGSPVWTDLVELHERLGRGRTPT